jgi:hypothetical protein
MILQNANLDTNLSYLIIKGIVGIICLLINGFSSKKSKENFLITPETDIQQLKLMQPVLFDWPYSTSKLFALLNELQSNHQMMGECEISDMECLSNQQIVLVTKKADSNNLGYSIRNLKVLIEIKNGLGQIFAQPLLPAKDPEMGNQAAFIFSTAFADYLVDYVQNSQILVENDIICDWKNE